MDPQRDLSWNSIITLNVKSWIDRVRYRMKEGGVWSIDQLRTELGRFNAATTDARVQWVGGVRLEFARLIMHLAPINPNPRGKPFCHPTLGACNAADRMLVTSRIPFDVPHDLIVRRDDLGR